jgi:hypothetical protein
MAKRVLESWTLFPDHGEGREPQDEKACHNFRFDPCPNIRQDINNVLFMKERNRMY